MKHFWDERYGSEEYVYGTEPNNFFKQELQKLKPGKLLLPAEGEGRNAVFAAKLGWEVVAFDYSQNGRDKAFDLAKRNQVSIEYILADYTAFSAVKESFDCVALIYAHVMDGNRAYYHQKLIEFLKPGAHVLLEAFSKEQIHNNTGGPPNLEFLFSKEELASDFNSLSEVHIEALKIKLNEGGFHQGEADVIRLTGVK
jgi:SAM-dependent methyltransferase